MAMASSALPLPFSFSFFHITPSRRTLPPFPLNSRLFHRRRATRHDPSLPPLSVPSLPRRKRFSFSVSLGRRLGPTFSDSAKHSTELLPSSSLEFTFEEGIFESDFPSPETSDQEERNRKQRDRSKSNEEARDKEELVPEDWKFLQEDLHKTKVQRRRESRMQETANRQLKELRAQIRRRRKVDRESLLTEYHSSVPFRAKLPDKEELLELEKVLAHRPLRKEQQDIEFEQMFTDDEKLQLKRRIPDFNLINCEKWLALHVLAASGQYFFLEQFLNMGIDMDLDARDEDGYTALQRAVQGRKDIAVSQLLNAGADVNVCDKDGANLLHFSVQNSALNLVRLMIRHGVQVNHADKYGWTPLHVAVLIGRSDIVRHLIVSGADKTLKNKEGLTPIDIVLAKGKGKGGDGYAVAKVLKRLPTVNLR